jgi:hypothetical protein
MLLLTLHNLATTYNLLPSEALVRSSTFDLMVLDVATKWSKYQQTIADGKTMPSKKLTQEEMKSMINRAKNFVLPKVKGAE